MVESDVKYAHSQAIMVIFDFDKYELQVKFWLRSLDQIENLVIIRYSPALFN